MCVGVCDALCVCLRMCEISETRLQEPSHGSVSFRHSKQTVRAANKFGHELT